MLWQRECTRFRNNVGHNIKKIVFRKISEKLFFDAMANAIAKSCMISPSYTFTEVYEDV